MKDLYTTLERTLIAVFGVYLLGAAAIVINNMMKTEYTDIQMIGVIAGFTLMWLVGGVIMPAVIKAYEVNKIMGEIDDIGGIDEIMDKMRKNSKRKNKKGDK